MGERTNISPFPPGSSFSFLVPSYPHPPSLSIPGASTDRAIFFLESAVGEGETMKRGDDESEVRGELTVDTNRGG